MSEECKRDAQGGFLLQARANRKVTKMETGSPHGAGGSQAWQPGQGLEARGSLAGPRLTPEMRMRDLVRG